MKIFSLIALLVLASCSPQKPTEDPPKDVEPEVKKEDPHPSLGDACTRDGNCDTYLRCIDSKCAIPPAITGEKTDETPYVEFLDTSDETLATFHVELATTGPEMTRGLMHRREMLDDWGMLFIYPDEDVRSFWMRNTLIPLDIIFVEAGGTVAGVVVGAEPLTLTSRTVGKPSRYVVEVNAGLSVKLGIVAGTQMRIANVAPEFQIPE